MDRKTKEYNMSLKTVLGLLGLNKYQKQTLIDEVTPIISDHVSDQVCGYAYQVALDAFALVLNEQLGVGADRWAKIQDAVRKLIVELDATAEEETIEALHYGNYEENGKVDFIQLKYKLDARLKPILGSNFKPYDERYKLAQENEKHHTWKQLEEMAKAWK